MIIYDRYNKDNFMMRVDITDCVASDIFTIRARALVGIPHNIDNSVAKKSHILRNCGFKPLSYQKKCATMSEIMDL